MFNDKNCTCFCVQLKLGSTLYKLRVMSQVHHTVILLSSFLNLKKNNLAEGLIHKLTILLNTSKRETVASSILGTAQPNLPNFISVFITQRL